MVSTHAMLKKSGSMVTETGLRSNDQQATASSGPATLEAKHEHHFCGMLHISFIPHLLQAAMGLQLKVGFAFASGSPVTVSLSGLIGGGVTLGNSAIAAGSGFVTREVTAEVNIPAAMRSMLRTEEEGRLDYLTAVKFAVKEILHQERRDTSAGRLAAKAQARKTMILNKIGDVPNLIKKFGYYVPKGGDIHIILRSQLKHTLIQFSDNLETLLKETATEAKGKQPTKAAHKRAVKMAYFITYVDPLKDNYKDEAKWTTKSPSCATIHTKFPKRPGLDDDHPGIRNLLCEFMCYAYLIPDLAVDSLLHAVSHGYRNTLLMVEQVLESIVEENLDVIYGETSASPSDRSMTIDNYVQSLQLGKSSSALTGSPVILRSLGAILTHTKEDASKLLDIFTNEHGFKSKKYVCEENDPSCGIVVYRTEFTYGFTLGFGGDINFCTPDTNLVQVYRTTTNDYIRQDGQVVQQGSSERTLKLVLSGTVLFQAELSWDWKWEKTNLKEVKFIVRVPVEDATWGHKSPPSDTPTQELFDKFFAQNGIKIAQTLCDILATGSAINAAKKEGTAQSNSLNGERTKFIEAFQQVSRRFRRRLLMSPGTPTGAEFFQTLANGLGGNFLQMTGAHILSEALKKIFKEFSPLSFERKQYIGGEVTLTKSGGSWQALQGGVFHLFWTGLNAGTEGLPMDFKLSGYYGMSTEARLRLI